MEELIKQYTSDKLFKKYLRWKKTKKNVQCGAVGGCFEYCFSPTGIGMLVVVKCSDGTEIDLTDTENW